MKTVRVLAMCSASLVGTLAVLALFAWLPSLSQGPATAQAAALANGGFEGAYQPWPLPQAVTVNIASGWSLWYTTSWPDEQAHIDLPRANEVSSPVHGGSKAQEVHGNGTKNFDACLYQQIGVITVGNYVRFSAWAKVVTAMGPWDMQTRVGIDPHGAANPIDIQYETHPGYWDPYDSTGQEWQRLSVVLMATSPTVTVYACAHPKYAMSFQAYWDDAEFSVVPEQRSYLPVAEREHCVVAPGTLYNPGLEKDYCTLHGYQTWPVPSVKVEVAPYWQPFCNYVPNQDTHKWPEFGYTDRSYRVHSGAVAQQYGTSGGGAFEAGIYQVITGTQVGDVLRFTIWGLGWTQEWDRNDPDGYNERLSDHQEPGGLSFKVGIDPWGGQSFASSNIIWSPTYDPYDAWHQFEITATAMYTRVSVWAFAHPTIATMRWNQTFWDNANLEVTSMP